MNNIIKNILYAIALLLLCIAIADMILWFRACAQYEGFEQIKQAYRSHFPESLKGHYTITFITTGMLIISTGIFAFATGLDFKRKLSLGLTIFSGVLLWWHIFSLM
jgi:hypothetical protein